MQAQDAVTVLQHVQTATSAYALYLCYQSISNTLPYESSTKKAAEYTNIASDQLKWTRTTLAAGTGASIISLLASLSPHVGSLAGPTAQTILSVGTICTLLVARKHLARFWEGKYKVPLVEKYNTAISSSNQLKDLLGYSAIGWAIILALRGVAALIDRGVREGVAAAATSS